MPRWKLFAGLLPILILTAPNALGDGTIPGARLTSARAAGMADAFLPLADDAGTALFYNPAGLGQIRGTHFEPGNIQMQANDDFLNGFDTNYYKVTSLSNYAPVIKQHPGIFPGVSTALFPNFSSRGFAMGVLYSARVSAQSDGTTVHYRSHYQLIPTAGIGARFFSGRLRLGYSFQWVNQASGDVVESASTTPMGYNQFLHQGSALSHNLGASLNLPMQYLPSFNVVARNVLGANYGTYSVVNLTKNPSSAPADEPMTVDASFSLQPKIVKGSNLNIVFEERDVMNKTGLSLLERATVGLELNIRSIFFLRGGYGSSYPAAGFGVRTARAEFGFSWFSEELGTPTLRVRDVRYVLQYQIRAF